MSVSRILEIQELIMIKLHPAFVKGGVSICIGAITFISIFFSTDDAEKYIGAFALWIIKGTFGLVGIMLNQFRDAISSYYAEKQKARAESNTTTITDTTIVTK